VTDTTDTDSKDKQPPSLEEALKRYYDQQASNAKDKAAKS